MRDYRILLTNDDGIDSVGLKIAAAGLSRLGQVVVVAPREEASSSGRSLPLTSDLRIEERVVEMNGSTWKGYAVGGTPGQAVLHALIEILPEPPDLVVSGINFGENVGNIITVSGTIGAALEGASMGVPGLAVSLQIPDWESFFAGRYSPSFETAAFFTTYFAEKMLTQKLPPDVDVLKVDVPGNANPDTPWRITRVSKHRYYTPYIKEDEPKDSNTRLGIRVNVGLEDVCKDTDVHAILSDFVSVTPISLDLTSRVDLAAIESILGDRK